MLDRQRGEMRVGGEISGGPQPAKQIEEHSRVAVARMHERDLWLREPRLDVRTRIQDR